MTQKKNSGQILVIILIVMLVLGIIVVSVTNNVIRDISQSRQNTQYESLYSVSEKHVLNLSQSLPVGQINNADTLSDNVIDVLRKTGFDITSSDCKEDTSLTDRTAVICEVIDDTNPELTDSRLRIRVIDSPYIDNVPLSKDETIMFYLDNTSENATMLNNDTFTVTLDGEGINNSNYDIALEVMFDFKYLDNNNIKQYSTVRVTYDKLNTDGSGEVFTAGTIGSSDPIDLFFNILNPSPNQATTFTFNYNDIVDNIRNQYTNKFIDQNQPIIPVQFRFKPIIKTTDPKDIPEIRLTVMNANPLNVTQSRIFQATSYTVRDGEVFGAQAFVEANVAAFKTPSIFDYILRSNTEIRHEVPTP